MRWFKHGLLLSTLLIVLAACGTQVSLQGLLPEAAMEAGSADMPATVLGSIYSEFEQSVDADGMPLLGSDDAPVQVTVVVNFGCIHCANFERDVMPSLLERVREGEIQLRHISLATFGGEHIRYATQAGYCLADQDAYWEYQAMRFDAFLDDGSEAMERGRITADFNAAASNADMAAAQACVDGSESARRVSRGEAILAQFGVSSTPTIIINGVVSQSRNGDAINAEIDRALAESA